jgi:hypothetical protein
MFDEKSSRLLFRPQDGEMGACVIEGMMLARPCYLSKIIGAKSEGRSAGCVSDRN